MITCMVTCGRGLGDFAVQEILEKVPGASDLRHLDEGKLTFKVCCQGVNITNTNSAQGQKRNNDRINLDDKVDSKAAREKCRVTNTVSKNFTISKEVKEDQEAVPHRTTVPLEMASEDEDQFDAAVSHIFKLKLVERVFILLHCEDIGASLSSRPLSLRSYIPHLTLRSTISQLMARLSCIPPEAIVLDPMCGGGSILAEAATNFDVSHVIASDSSREQLEVARCNLQNIRAPVTLMQADAQDIPLQDSSVNTVLCDFPFGQKHRLTKESEQILSRVLREMHRVLMYGGRGVFLLSPRQSEVVSLLANNRTKTSSKSFADSSLILLETHFVALGETSANVVVLAKEQLTSEAAKIEERGLLF